MMVSTTPTSSAMEPVRFLVNNDTDSVSHAQISKASNDNPMVSSLALQDPPDTSTEVVGEEPTTDTEWIAQLSHYEDPDYELDSVGHLTPRSNQNHWASSQLQQAEIEYQKTVEGMEPCTSCDRRRIYCYRCDQYTCRSCRTTTCPACQKVTTE